MEVIKIISVSIAFAIFVWALWSAAYGVGYNQGLNDGKNVSERVYQDVAKQCESFLKEDE